MDDELKRIEDEIRKAKEKRQALEDRKNRRLKQIRVRQDRDRAAWLKKMSAVLDKTLSEMKGKTYFYEVTQEQIAEALKSGEISEDAPAEDAAVEKADQKDESAVVHMSHKDSDAETQKKEESR